MGNRLSRIYTRTGDDGTTGLGDGKRVRKDDARVEAYGTVDEANSAIGVILSVPGLPADVARCLTEIQHDLFDLGGELCIPGTKVIKAEQISQLEQVLDKFNDPLPALKDFILPGGGPAAAHCHLARTIVRRAERCVWTLAASRAGQRRGAEIPEPAVGPAVRDRARARTPRARSEVARGAHDRGRKPAAVQGNRDARFALGVVPACWRNAALNVDLELKPASRADLQHRPIG